MDGIVPHLISPELEPENVISLSPAASPCIERLAGGISHTKQLAAKNPSTVAGSASGMSMRKLDAKAPGEIPLPQNCLS
jgi:hypothetical protein